VVETVLKIQFDLCGTRNSHIQTFISYCCWNVFMSLLGISYTWRKCIV